MKKRWIVSAAALSAAALAVTGCGASASDSSVSGNSGDSAASGDAGELYVYNWGEYIDESVIDEFEEETGIKVVYDLYETNEEMYPVIEAGGIAYDAVCPSDFMIQKMREHDLLAEINFDNVPNITWSFPSPSIRNISTLFRTPGAPSASSTTRSACRSLAFRHRPNGQTCGMSA